MTRLMLAALIVACASACTTTTTFRRDDSGGGAGAGDLIVDDHDYGPLSDSVDVPVGLGIGPVRYEVRDGGEVIATGEVPRDQVIWGIVLGAGAAAVCCVPTLAASGFCLANPLALGGCLAGNVGSALVACQAPGWSTLPLVSVSSAIGATPLLFGLIGAHPAPEVLIQMPKRQAPIITPTAPTQPTAAPAPTAQRSDPNPLPVWPTQPEGVMWF